MITNLSAHLVVLLCLRCLVGAAVAEELERCLKVLVHRVVRSVSGLQVAKLYISRSVI